MASQTLENIVESLSSGRMGIDDFMRAVEEHVNVLHPDSPDLGKADEEHERDLGSELRNVTEIE